MKSLSTVFSHPNRKPKSMRVIMVFNLCAVAILCIVMVFLTALRSMDAAEKNRFQTALRTFTEQLDKQIHQEFISIINISQQMLPSGHIGSMAEIYLNSTTPYEKITNKKTIDNLIGQSAFSSNQIELVAYWEKNANSLWISNMSVQNDFSPLQYDILSQTTSIDFHSIHRTANRFTDAEVFSIVRPVYFSDDKSRYIYIEYRTDIASSIKALEKEQGIPYRFIQLDKNNVVRYSTTEDISAGTVFNLNGEISRTADMTTGRNQQYVWCYAPQQFGFKNVLLLPQQYYDSERIQLQREIFIFSLFALCVILLLSWFFHNRMYRPLKLIEEEFKVMGSGDMSVRHHTFPIEEYQVLYNHFLTLKQQVHQLMQDIYRKESEKRKLELDKLYFQINPHFIMNALYSAQWQARLGNQPAIADYLSHLNFILGYTLDKVSQNTTLNSEIKMLTEYLSLQQTRQDFEIHMNITPGIYLDSPCARLILQPIAENAICHNLHDFGNLWIDIAPTDRNFVLVSIRDDGVGFDDSSTSYKDSSPFEGERQTKSGIGLRYVWITLQDFYGSNATMEVQSSPGQGTSVTLSFPILP